MRNTPCTLVDKRRDNTVGGEDDYIGRLDLDGKYVNQNYFDDEYPTVTKRNMLSKISSSINILLEDGPHTLAKKAKNHLLYSRDWIREVNSPAIDIYDCFIFYNELELLEMRLNELCDIVDYFVVVEATQTFQGDKKPLYFKNNREKFSEFSDKIIYHSVEYPSDLNTSWGREYYLRDSIKTALSHKTNIQHQDKVIISDADEIPSISGIKTALDSGGLNIFSQKHHYYFYNMRRKGDMRWLGPVMSDYGNFTSGQDFRNKRPPSHQKLGSVMLMEMILTLKYKHKINIVTNGGWHFSYLGDVEDIINKIETFSHTEYNKNEYKNKERIQEAMEEGYDLFGRDSEYEVVELDETYPKYLVEKSDEYAHNIKSY